MCKYIYIYIYIYTYMSKCSLETDVMITRFKRNADHAAGKTIVFVNCWNVGCWNDGKTVPDICNRELEYRITWSPKYYYYYYHYYYYYYYYYYYQHCYYYYYPLPSRRKQIYLHIHMYIHLIIIMFIIVIIIISIIVIIIIRTRRRRHYKLILWALGSFQRCSEIPGRTKQVDRQTDR